jgi:hypothetical protein
MIGRRYKSYVTIRRVSAYRKLHKNKTAPAPEWYDKSDYDGSGEDA